jgi:hypothetical protein
MYFCLVLYIYIYIYIYFDWKDKILNKFVSKIILKLILYFLNTKYMSIHLLENHGKQIYLFSHDIQLVKE